MPKNPEQEKADVLLAKIREAASAFPRCCGFGAGRSGRSRMTHLRRIICSTRSSRFSASGRTANRLRERTNAMGKGSDEEYMDFLDGLRESGITNMLGAAPYLSKEFGLSPNDAREILSKWMKRFGAEDDHG